MRVLQLRRQVNGNSAGAVVPRHTLDTTGNTDLQHSGLDLLRDVGYGLQSGRALSVDGVERGGVGESGVDDGHAAGFGTAELGEDVSDRYIFDQGGIDLGLVEGCSQDLRRPVSHQLTRVGWESWVGKVGRGAIRVRASPRDRYF